MEHKKDSEVSRPSLTSVKEDDDNEDNKDQNQQEVPIKSSSSVSTLSPSKFLFRLMSSNNVNGNDVVSPVSSPAPLIKKKTFMVR